MTFYLLIEHWRLILDNVSFIDILVREALWVIPPSMLGWRTLPQWVDLLLQAELSSWEVGRVLGTKRVLLVDVMWPHPTPCLRYGYLWTLLMDWTPLGGFIYVLDRLGRNMTWSTGEFRCRPHQDRYLPCTMVLEFVDGTCGPRGTLRWHIYMKTRLLPSWRKLLWASVMIKEDLMN